MVVGDVNSTIACGLVAVKMGVKLIHVEAGLRSFDMNMPKEINRVLTDRISDLLFVTEQSGLDNLKNEGVADEKVHITTTDILANYEQIKSAGFNLSGRIPEFWDGKAAKRITEIIAQSD